LAAVDVNSAPMDIGRVISALARNFQFPEYTANWAGDTRWFRRLVRRGVWYHIHRLGEPLLLSDVPEIDPESANMNARWRSPSEASVNTRSSGYLWIIHFPRVSWSLRDEFQI
jgi:hypothetical protein